MRFRLRILLVFCSFLIAGGNLWAKEGDRRLAEMGYIDPCTLDSTLRVHLVYATADNFLKKVLYTDISKAWLRPEAARKLVRAQQLLKKEYPHYSLLIYDAARPISVQRQMWSLVRGTDKTYYVSNPSKGGGLHNYGMAVDVTIVDEQGKPLPMGTPFDYFGEKANTDREEELVRTGKISPEEFKNRRLLRRFMRGAGFTTITSEWWHFNACSRQEARANLPLIP